MLEKKKRFCIYLKFVLHLYTRLSVVSWWSSAGPGGGVGAAFNSVFRLVANRGACSGATGWNPLADRQDGLTPVRLRLVPLTPHSGPVWGRGDGRTATIWWVQHRPLRQHKNTHAAAAAAAAAAWRVQDRTHQLDLAVATVRWLTLAVLQLLLHRDRSEAPQWDDTCRWNETNNINLGHVLSTFIRWSLLLHKAGAANRNPLLFTDSL